MRNATGILWLAAVCVLWLALPQPALAAPTLEAAPAAAASEALAPVGRRAMGTVGSSARQEPPTQQDPAQQEPPEQQEPPVQQESPAQEPPASEESSPLQQESIFQQVEALPASEAEVLRFQNREIATLRARVLGRLPADRAGIAIQRLTEIIERGGTHAVTLVAVDTAMLVEVDNESIIAIVEQDLDGSSFASVSEQAAAAAAALRTALAEAQEMRNPAILLAAAGRVAIATLLFVIVVAVLKRVRLRLVRSVVAAATERLSGTGTTGRILWAEVRFDLLAPRLLLVISGAVALTASYLWLTFSLRQFPYTRPWGEALGERLLATLAWIGHGIVNAVPGLFTIVIVVLLTRIATRVVHAFFTAVHDGRVRLVGLDPEAARPTRQIVVAVLWILALVISYPYIPGSGTEAFRGISVFLGVVLSIGSTGIVNQAMSGLILMYSGTMKPGEYVECGDVEGTVMQLGMLSTRIRTLHREMVTVPNSVVLMRETTNYSRLANNGVPIKTSITLGYDLPWRQVHAILRIAAERTEGVREEPEPRILQTELSDFYVAYRIVAYVDEPRSRPRILSQLHANVLDICNEYGVQILSPHYVDDPEEPAIVPRERWHAPPAEPEDIDVDAAPDDAHAGSDPEADRQLADDPKGAAQAAAE